MRIILLITLLFAINRVAAIEDTPANRLREAQRYLESTPPKELFADIADQMAKNSPPQQRDLIRAMFTKYLDIDALTKAMMDSMVRHFTADELHALAEFYGSPVGKSAMKKFGIYMADVMPAIQAEMIKLEAKMNRELPDEKSRGPNQPPEPTSSTSSRQAPTTVTPPAGQEARQP
jgi:hypothetical protein